MESIPGYSMTREEIILEYLGKSGQDFDQVMADLEAERGMVRQTLPDRKLCDRHKIDFYLYCQRCREEESILMDRVEEAFWKEQARIQDEKIMKDRIAKFTETQMAKATEILQNLR